MRDIVRAAIGKAVEPFDCTTISALIDKSNPGYLATKRAGDVATTLLQLFQEGELFRLPKVEGQTGPAKYKRSQAKPTPSSYEDRKKALNISVPRDAEVEAS